MDEKQLVEFRKALKALSNGNFQPRIAIDHNDPAAAELGQSILDLGRSFQQRYREQQTLASITEKINAGLLLHEVVDHIFESFHTIIPYDRIGVALIDEDKNLVEACCIRSKAPEIKIDRGYSAPLKNSSLEKIIETGNPRIINNIELYLKEHPQSASTKLILAEGMRSSLTCPLLAMNKAIGFIFFSGMQTDTYKDLHIDLFIKIAGQLSVILEKSRMYEQLIQLNNLKNKFLGFAAHDLRSPIGVVKNFIILFLEGYLGKIKEKQRNVLVTMDKNCDRMLNLIGNLLDFSAIESGNLELNLKEFDLNHFFVTYYSMTKSLASNKQITLKLDIPKKLPPITADSDRIMQVLDNLITNALKFSYPKTTVTLSARKVDDSILMSVADQGQGIPKHEIKKIFQEFSKTSVKPTDGEKSTGLGLAIVKKIIEAHNGTITVESEVGKGTTFTINLPIGKQ
jgi:signal transduction histidine kinase